MEGKCIVTKVNLKYEQKIRKLSIVLSDGKTKKIAGFAQFDLSVALNLNMKQKEYSLNLIQCPDTKAFVEFTLLINSLDFLQHNNDIDVHKQLQQKVYDLKSLEPKRKPRKKKNQD
ncbi:unnamed protein product [Paramecium pentaurelia]|uniref:C2 NT-type domain-containing protein n=1 Tax=Paramecium pentaurelia TaxID=43138 RepID=A0A8S1SYL7_9CILI|nr:unnamed protein product [Paramecium pentaurelia]